MDGMMEGMRIALLLVVMALGGGAIAWHYLDAREAKATSDTSAIMPSEQEIEKERAVEDFFDQSPVDVTAKQLVRLWRTNEMAARQQYLGRPLRIDGHVDRVTVESVKGREFPLLHFTEGGVCGFTRSPLQPEIAQLRRGQRVVVLGQPLGTSPGLGPLNAWCVLESWYD